MKSAHLINSGHRSEASSWRWQVCQCRSSTMRSDGPFGFSKIFKIDKLGRTRAMSPLWQRLVTSHRLFITSCHPSFLLFRFCPSLSEKLHPTYFSRSLIYPQQSAVMEILPGQSPELGKSPSQYFPSGILNSPLVSSCTFEMRREN